MMIVMIIIDILLIFLLSIGFLIEKFLVKKNWSNPVINTFYIFNMIFSSPFNVVVGFFATGLIYFAITIYTLENNIISHSALLLMFIILTIFIGLATHRVWAINKKLKADYQSLVDFSKKFTFRTPLLVITFGVILSFVLGLFYPNLQVSEIITLTILSFYKIMLNGLYVVPLFMLVTKKINLKSILGVK